ncbi:IGF-like family receptor 1 Transmembrane protein 149 Precursor [Larimichthys crocea]|uniref:IGF-like family receptor 1 Transmembrane protein 149 n=2 Tax=Larimichthys crocea TaxID=215358 RepID=A0A6G0IB50_LARCR|nr:IGF-like family receptor 1 Transmembrane protein 149 Precursor [Larimichthys crocea]
MISPCTTTTDSQCEELRIPTTGVPVITSWGPILTTNSTMALLPTGPDKHWALPLAILIVILLVVLSAFVIYMKRNRRGQETVLAFNKRSSYMNAGFSSLSAAPSNNDLEDTSSAIMSAPLQTVLDNLDVLEELVILLDPESHAVKNTKHLASLCSFPATWITYTYSMKDSKSPLKAVLEGVTSRHPEWTVGHLAKLLRQMERNDAIALLARLRVNDMDV